MTKLELWNNVVTRCRSLKLEEIIRWQSVLLTKDYEKGLSAEENTILLAITLCVTKVHRTCAQTGLKFSAFTF